MEYASRLSTAVRRARETTATVRGPVDLLTNAGALVALAVVAAAAAFLLARRRGEAALLYARGEGAAAFGARTALEGALPVVLGTLAGFGLAAGLVAALGPDGPVDRGSLESAARAAAVRAPVALLLFALVAGVIFAGQARAGRPGRLHLPAIPWELPVLALAGFFLVRLLTVDPPAGDDADVVSRPSSYLFLFPIALIAGAAGLGARGLRRVVGALRTPTSKSSSEAAYLAVRRVAAARGLAVLLITASALGIGIFFYAETVVSSYRATVRAASLLATGSDVRGLTSFDTAIPADVPFPVTKTTLLYSEGTITLDGTPVDLLAVDAPTFAKAAYWDDRYASRPLAEIVRDLAAGGAGPLPVALVAGSAADRATLELEGDRLPVAIVERPRAFPALSRDRPLVVAAEAALLRAFERAGSPNHLDAPRALTELWARGESARTAELLGASTARPFPVTTAVEARSRPTVTAFTRTFAFLEALGLVAGLVAVVGLVVYLQARQRSRAVAFGLARRMGLGRGQHVRALLGEIGVLLGTAFLLALALSLGAAQLVLTRVEPLASLSPVPLFEPSPALIVVGLAGLAGIALAGALLADRAAARANLAEVLRDDE